MNEITLLPPLPSLAMGKAILEPESKSQGEIKYEMSTIQYTKDNCSCQQ